MNRFAKTINPNECDELVFVAIADDGSRWVSEENFDAAIDELTEALGWFMEDERFQVGVGGNPIAVEKMLAEVRLRMAAARQGIKNGAL